MVDRLDSGKYDLKGRNFNYDVTWKEIIFHPQQVSFASPTATVRSSLRDIPSIQTLIKRALKIAGYTK